MRKRVIPRIIFISLLYFAIFLLLVSMQFSKGGAFTRNVGSFMVQGNYRTDRDKSTAERRAADRANEVLLEGDTRVIFGGMEFALVNRRDGQSMRLTGDGWSREALPESMAVSGNSVSFAFPGGTELAFANINAGTSSEMRITALFAEGVTGIELPFKLQRKASIQGSGNGQFIVSADGIKYTFGNSPIDADRRLLLVRAEGEPVSYKTLSEPDAFSPDSFVLREAETADAYNAAVARWIDQNFSLWSRSISGLDNEDIVIALATEAYGRGSYRAAVNAVSTAFRNGPNRTYESSVYLGGMDSAYLALIAAESGRLGRLTRLINDRSFEFLLEPNVFEYFGIRGYQSLMDAAADLVDTIDPGILGIDFVPGILEGFMDWAAYGVDPNNPFTRLTDQALSVITPLLARTDFSPEGDQGAFEGRVFLLYNGAENHEFNLRLGKALMNYAEAVGYASWAGVGRSLILSALYGTGEDYDSAHSELANAKLYRILNPSRAYPRAAAITPQSGTWVWTTAPAVIVTQGSSTLDIDVTFLLDETHFMIIRGVQPFNRIQLYGIDFRTDPQFERYNSSGWSYSTRDQTLILKVLHRNQVERIRIIY